ncbi:hypothetical protein, partial [Planktomarina temperata]|uniref:hypothetical protein n=1 Tax=Planktomarina temperata TaxID=1284658 RepID=UPI003260FBC3
FFVFSDINPWRNVFATCQFHGRNHTLRINLKKFSRRSRSMVCEHLMQQMFHMVFIVNFNGV